MSRTITRSQITLASTAICAAIMFASPLVGQETTTQNAGQAELDKAVELQLDAKTLPQFEQVAKLCETALTKGLDQENQDFAKQILVSALFQHASRVADAIVGKGAPDPRWQLLRQFALRDLRKIVKYDPDMGDAHLMTAKLQLLPGGDRKEAQAAANKAIKLFPEHNIKLAEALLVRAQLQTDPKKQMEDLTAAMKADPSNSKAWQARALLMLKEGKTNDGVKELEALLKEHDDNLAARLALAEAYYNMEKYDEALEQTEAVIKQQPESSLGFTLRARIHAVQDKLKAAVADLNQALLVQPRDLTALLLRARLHHALEERELARADVDRLLKLRPGLPQGIYLNSLLLAAEDKYDEAIIQLEKLTKLDDSNLEWKLQLAAMHQYSGRPRRAIDMYGAIIKEDPKNWMALRARADALLSVGKHVEAIQDYEVALKQQPEHDGILNNLAWVMATSPKKKVRNGKRAIELATKACELTEYKAAHILSTLASAYAETGDFETALKWSAKAIELSDDETKEQLKEELESYKKKKPWRELQETDEKKPPVDPADLQT